MKTFAPTAVIVVALACCACGSGGSSGKGPEAQARPEPQTSPVAQTSSKAPASTLPPQFTGNWKVDGDCSRSDTGLDVGDAIEIEDRPGLKITLAPNHPTHHEDPVLLQNPTLTVVNPEGATSSNVLTAVEAEALCKATYGGFGRAFWSLLVKHSFKLTYVAGAGQVHTDQPGERTLLVFLPYVVEGQESKPQFFLGVVSLTRAKLHNGIVHGQQ
jgi:hypothetical protein